MVALTNPSVSDMSYTKELRGEYLIIDTPGEYSVSGISMRALGWQAPDGQERTVQRWNIEDIILLHLGGLNRQLTDQELQELEKTDIDVLFLPIGGGDSLTTKEALKLLTTIEPKIVIPIHYKVPNLKESLESVEQFAKEMGVDAKIREKKVILKNKKLPTEQMQTILLAP